MVLPKRIMKPTKLGKTAVGENCSGLSHSKVTLAAAGYSKKLTQYIPIIVLRQEWSGTDSELSHRLGNFQKAPAQHETPCQKGTNWLQALWSGGRNSNSHSILIVRRWNIEDSISLKHIISKVRIIIIGYLYLCSNTTALTVTDNEKLVGVNTPENWSVVPGELLSEVKKFKLVMRYGHYRVK